MKPILIKRKLEFLGMVASIAYLMLLSEALQPLTAQNFLKQNGTKIVDATTGAEVLLNGVNVGSWMVQEGYIMATSTDAQWQTKQQMLNANAETVVEDFYRAFRANYITKPDIDLIGANGFNCVRLPLHYELFLTQTQRSARNAAIKNPGTIATYRTSLTNWYNANQLFVDPNLDAFVMIDNLLSWCASNNLYVILDLHAAPGGQGGAQGIADAIVPNDLWNQQIYKDMTVRLWQTISTRYKNNPRIAMYDLINEPNGLPNNTNLKALYERCITAIRGNGDTHLIMLEGNGYGNEYTGMLPSNLNVTDKSNLVYNAHRYWIDNSVTATDGNANQLGLIGNLINFRNANNVPVWVGETNENSNEWFTAAAKNLNAQGIGWCHWTIKRVDGTTEMLNVKPYGNIQNAADRAMLLNNILYANCTQNKDVLDALNRQLTTNNAAPYKTLSIPGVINAVDYDMGRYGVTFSDTRYQRLSWQEPEDWNAGRIRGGYYRNDGIDIQTNTDASPSNGYDIGYMVAGEWMKYTVNVASTGVYNFQARVKSSGNSQLSLTIDNNPIGTILITSNGAWNTTAQSAGVTLTSGVHSLIIKVDVGGMNLSWINFTSGSGNMVPVTSITSPANNATFSAPASVTINANASDSDGTITKVEFYNGTTLIGTDTSSPYSFTWTNVPAGSYSLTTKATDNNTGVGTSAPINITVTTPPMALPGILEAENFFAMNGVQTETTTDTGGGMDVGWIDAGDWMDYNVNVVSAGTYTLAYRVASQPGGGQLQLRSGSTTLSAITIAATGGWQNWVTLTSTATLSAGNQTLRLYAGAAGFNVNWVQFSQSGTPNSSPVVSITSPANNASYVAPASVVINASATDSDGTISKVEFYNGATLLGTDTSSPYSFTWSNVAAGTYSLTAKATDNNTAATTSSVVAIVVNNPNAPPTVSITSPANNSSYTALATITINASATDSDGTVSKVDFYNGATLLGTDTSSPYSFTWSNVAAGTYSLTAKATDNNMAVTTSSSVTVVVTNGGVAIPGTIQAESYAAMNGIQTETTTDTGGGLNVGWIDAGDWMDYNVNVATAGTYTVNFRIASNAGGQVQLRSGSTTLATVNITSTGGWQNWTTLSANANLSAGNQTLRLYAGAAGFNLNWVQFVVGSANPWDATKTYKIISTVSGKALDIEGPSSASGSMIHQWTRYALTSQLWRIVDVGNGYYKLVSEYTNGSGNGLVLDAIDVNSNTILMQQRTYTGAESQKFKIVDMGSGNYKLQVSTGRVMDLDGADAQKQTDGDKLRLWDDTGITSQRWQIIVSNASTARSITDVAEEISLSIFPNPATSVITISGENLRSFKSAEVMDAQGKVYMTHALQSETTHVIPLDVLQPGFYILNLRGTGKQTVKKFIKR
jgi:endoglucanase